MRSAPVHDLGMWFCNSASPWNVVRAHEANGVLQVPPTEYERLGPAPRQVAECLVGGMRVVVVFANNPKPLPDEARSLGAALRALFEGAPVIVVLASAEGRIDADTSYCDGDDALHAAYLAAAVIQVRWGWDDSPVIRIESSGRGVEVVPTWDGARWHASLLE